MYSVESVEIVQLNLLSSLGMRDLSQTLVLKHGARFTCLIVGLFVVPNLAASLLGSRLQMPADVE